MHASHQAEAGPLVDSPAGKLRGTMGGDVRLFKGIPYAEPPIGPRRWQAPRAMPRWTGVRDATAFGPACFQPETKLSNIYANAPWPMNEECKM